MYFFIRCAILKNHYFYSFDSKRDPFGTASVSEQNANVVANARIGGSMSEDGTPLLLIFSFIFTYLYHFIMPERGGPIANDR